MLSSRRCLAPGSRRGHGFVTKVPGTGITPGSRLRHAGRGVTFAQPSFSGCPSWPSSTMSRRKRSEVDQSTMTRSFRCSSGSWYRWYGASPTSRRSRAGAGRARPRSPCCGRASPPGPASGSRTAPACLAGSSPAASPGAARAGTSAGRDGRCACWGPARSRRATRRARARHAQQLVHLDAAALVERHPRARAAAGSGATPAVQTSVCAGIRVPSPSTTSSAVTESSVVPTWISTPRLASSFAAYSPSRDGLSGRIRGAASTSTQRRGTRCRPG